MPDFLFCTNYNYLLADRVLITVCGTSAELQHSAWQCGSCYAQKTPVKMEQGLVRIPGQSLWPMLGPMRAPRLVRNGLLPPESLQPPWGADVQVF